MRKRMSLAQHLLRNKMKSLKSREMKDDDFKLLEGFAL